MQTLAQENLKRFITSIGLNADNIQDFALLSQALTHKSYAADFSNITDHNERLEFVGDAILGSAVATFLFENHPTKTEAEMTLYKIALVREEMLARVAADIGIQNIVRISKGEEKSGGRQKAAILSDTLEALIGYIALDMGYNMAYDFVKRHICIHTKSLSLQGIKSAKAQLQEMIQKKHKAIPSYVDVIDTENTNENTVTYRSDVYMGANLLGSGYGSSKKKAQEDAAHNAIVQLTAGQVQANK